MHQILRLNTFNEQDHGQNQRKSMHQQIELGHKNVKNAKKKKKRKSTYAYESTKAIHVTIKVLHAYDMKKKVM